MGKVNPKKMLLARYKNDEEKNARVPFANWGNKLKGLVPQLINCCVTDCVEEELYTLPDTTTCTNYVHKPRPTSNTGMDLNIPDIEMTPLTVTGSHPSNTPVDRYQTLCVDLTNALPVAVTKSEGTPYNYKLTISHLPNLEITRVHSHDPPSLSNMPPLVNRFTQANFSSAQINKIEAQGDPTPQQYNQCNCAKPKTSTLPTNKTPKHSKPVRRRKSLIPEDMKDKLTSAGIDEDLTSNMIVESNIENFRENVSTLGRPEDLARFKDIRRKGKNRNAAKQSRQRKMDNLEGLRVLHKKTKHERDDLRKLVNKIQLMEAKYNNYRQLYKEKFVWHRHEDERKFEKSIGSDGFPR